MKSQRKFVRYLFLVYVTLEVGDFFTDLNVDDVSSSLWNLSLLFYGFTVLLVRVVFLPKTPLILKTRLFF